jgi:hypothetical protein
VLLLAGAALAAPSVDLALGARALTRRDEAFSPRTYVAPAPSARLGASVPGDRWSHRLSLDLAMGSARSGPAWSFTVDGERRDTPPSSLVEVSLREATLHAVPGPLPLQLGLGPALDVSTATFAFGRGGVFTYFGTIGLDAAARLEVPLPGPHRLDVQLGAPLAAWVARSPYALNDDRYIDTIAAGGGVGAVFGLLGRGRVESWGTRQAVRAGAAWTWSRRVVSPTASVDLALERQLAPWGGVLVRRAAGVSVGARFGGSAT